MIRSYYQLKISLLQYESYRMTEDLRPRYLAQPVVPWYPSPPHCTTKQDADLYSPVSAPEYLDFTMTALTQSSLSVMLVVALVLSAPIPLPKCALINLRYTIMGFSFCLKVLSCTLQCKLPASSTSISILLTDSQELFHPFLPT